MSKILLLAGDSNAKRWIPHLCETYKKFVTFVPSHNLEEIPSAMSQVTSSYQMVVYAGLSNVIVSAGDGASNSVDRMERIQTAISDVVGILSSTMANCPDPTYFFAMPTPRLRPQWYNGIQGAVCRLILSTLKSSAPSIRPLRAFTFSPQDMDSDGIHLNSLAGMSYLNFLIDHPRELIELTSAEENLEAFDYLSRNQVEISATVAATQLEVRVLKDQMAVTRCMHAEEACGRQNVDNLNRLVIIGGPFFPLSEQLQAKLKSQVAFFVRAAGPRLPTDIVHVRQFRGKRGAIYDVEMASVASSQRIRAAFGTFYRRGSAGPPPELAKLTVTNSLTFASRVRVRILKEIAKKHKAANAESDLSVFVTNYLPRPTLKLKEMRGPLYTYSYCEAVQKFSHHLTPEFLLETTKFANTNIAKDDLTPIFLVLSPDFLRAHLPIQTPPPGSSGQIEPGLQRSRERSSAKRKSSSNPVVPTVSKRGRPRGGGPRAQGRWGKRKGPVPMDTDTGATGTDTEIEPQDEIETVASIVPIDFSQETED